MVQSHLCETGTQLSGLIDHFWVVVFFVCFFQTVCMLPKGTDFPNAGHHHQHHHNRQHHRHHHQCHRGTVWGKSLIKSDLVWSRSSSSITIVSCIFSQASPVRWRWYGSELSPHWSMAPPQCQNVCKDDPWKLQWMHNDLLSLFFHLSSFPSCPVPFLPHPCLSSCCWEAINSTRLSGVWG